MSAYYGEFTHLTVMLPCGFCNGLGAVTEVQAKEYDEAFPIDEPNVAEMDADMERAAEAHFEYWQDRKGAWMGY